MAYFHNIQENSSRQIIFILTIVNLIFGESKFETFFCFKYGGKLKNKSK